MLTSATPSDLKIEARVRVDIPEATTQRTDYKECDANMKVLTGYEGPCIGFGGHGITFTAQGTITSSRDMEVEIGFVQALTSSETKGIYQRRKCVRRTVEPLPMKDRKPGSLKDDIWYAPPKKFHLLPNQALHLVEITIDDEVKTNFPVSLDTELCSGFGKIKEFHLTREFTTCLAVRECPQPGALTVVPTPFFVYEVRWKCQYKGVQLAEGNWQLPPEVSDFYTVLSDRALASPFTQPDKIKLDGPIVTDSEKITRS